LLTFVMMGGHGVLTPKSWLLMLLLLLLMLLLFSRSCRLV
jgi:hypothetical protein